MKIIRHFDIPDNVAEYIEAWDGINLSININNANADFGYGHMTWYTVIISKLTRTCNNCGYDPLWKPNDENSKCGHHTYNAWRYDEVFAWSPIENPMTLEESFDVWLKAQPKRWNEPAKLMIFGKIGW